MDEQLKQSALDFHEFPVPGKIQVSPTKPLATQRDLALAYSPGVAAPCLEIEKDPLAAYKYTARGNLVAVISNGTAVLGLGNIGALAGKPVMEGKGVLFKKFAGIDVFDGDNAALAAIIAKRLPLGLIHLRERFGFPKARGKAPPDPAAPGQKAVKTAPLVRDREPHAGLGPQAAQPVLQQACVGADLAGEQEILA